MPNNVCATERCLRSIIGLILISQVFVGLETPFGWVGVLVLLSAFFGFCPVYRVLSNRKCHH